MKVGDLVECIVDDELGRLKAGDRHRVQRAFSSYDSEYIDIGVDPEGWSACRFKVVEGGVVRKKLSEMEPGDRFIGLTGEKRYRFVGECDGGWVVQARIGSIYVWGDGDEYEIVPPAPKPVARPFANGEEFAPHREKWFRWKSNSGCRFRAVDYEGGWIQFGGSPPMAWEDAFKSVVFEDGSPFGVVDSVCNGSES